MIEIKSVKKLSLANLFSFLYAVFGFLSALIFGIFVLASALQRGETTGPLTKFVLLNSIIIFLSAVFAAFLAGLLGWLFGFFSAGLYNIFARRYGGLKIESAGDGPEVKEENRQKELFPF